MAVIRRTLAARFPEIDAHLPRLAQAIETAWAHCEKVAAAVPGPLAIERSAFANDPIVHALFASADDIAAMFGKSRCVRENFPHLALRGEHCHALLGMRLMEKKDLGWAQQGDLLVAENVRRLVYFTDHTLSEPAESEDETRAKIAESLFQGLATEFAERIAALRREVEDLRIAAGLERFEARAFPGEAEETETMLRQRLAELQPAALATAFAGFLSSADEHIGLETFTLRLNRAGVVCPEEDAGATTIALSRLHGRDRRRWIVFVARFRHDEIRAALERFQEASRYIVI